MDLRGKRILVTGGVGFIGSHTTQALIARGAQVSIVDRYSSGTAKAVVEGATLHKMDLRDNELDAIFQDEKPEYLFHFAGQRNVHASVEDPLTDAEQISASLHVMKRARAHSVKKVVFASSGILYGNNAPQPTDETSPFMPVNPYAISKHAIENYLLFYHAAMHLPCVILRHATVYGPGQSAGALTDYVRTLRDGRQADMWGDGTKTRDYVYIDDAVDANIRALDVSGNFDHPLFNIGTGVETRIIDLYRQIAELLGKKADPTFHPDRPGEQLRYCLDSTKFRTTTGWVPRTTLHEGLQKVLASHTV